MYYKYVFFCSQSHPLMTHSGFEHVFCYGDVLLSFVWTHDGPLQVKQKQPVISCTASEKPVSSFVAKHDFVRTQFHRTTHCDFCTKKVCIYLRDLQLLVLYSVFPKSLRQNQFFLTLKLIAFVRRLNK